MNKKLLGIAAVALLGASAAFAATTSTVYFTASGTLTKFISPLSGVEETSDDPSSGTRPHTDEKDVGVSFVYTNFEITKNESSYQYPCQGKYNGESITKNETANPLSVTYSKVGRVANASNVTDYTPVTPPYIYKEMYLNNLKFSKAYDYYFIPFYVVNLDISAHSWSGFDYYGNNSKTLTAPTEIKLTSSYSAYYYVQIEDGMNDLSTDDSKNANSINEQPSITSNGSLLAYLVIYTTTNYTGDSTTFNSVSIKLPEFYQ